MGGPVQQTLINFARTLDITAGISPLAPAAYGIEVVHDYFRREGMNRTADVSQTPLRLGFLDMSGYTAEDRGHVDLHLTVRSRVAPGSNYNYGGSSPSFWTAPDEDVSSGYAIGTATSPDRNAQDHLESPVEQLFALQLIQPNPSFGQTSISYSLARDGQVNLEIFDLQGARVRTVVQREMSAGTHGATWDGRNESGISLGAGTYFVRLASNQESAVRRFVLLR